MPVKWRKQWISDETFESCSVFDVNGDGVLDIVSGSFWYEGADFRKKHFIGKMNQYKEYFDAFSDIPMDITGNGRLDIITGGWWGGNLRWRENPGSAAEWHEHIVGETGNIETTRAWDIDGDGILEICPNTPNNNEVLVFKLDPSRYEKEGNPFTRHTVFAFPEGHSAGHGQGCGDITGRGRMDMVFRNGWLEAPDNVWDDDWVWHPDFNLGIASNPILVVDLTGNGLGDLIVGQAHGYGLDWYEQKIEGGVRTWVKHPIDPFNAQYHDLHWADIDGDGECELVTGKRHRAHCGNDKGEWDDVGIYYFKWTGEGFSKQVIDYGAIGQGKGCGICFALADLRGTGRLDLVAPGKDGLYIYYNEGC